MQKIKKNKGEVKNMNKNITAIVAGTAVTMAAGTAAYMAVKPKSRNKKMKQIKKTTGKALKAVGGIVNQMGDIMG